MPAPASVPVALMTCDSEGIVVAANPRCDALFLRPAVGETLETLLGTGAYDRLRHGGTARRQAKRANGTPFTVDVESALSSDGGLVVVLVPLLGARLLDETERFMDVAFEQMPVGMALFNTDGEYVRVNKALCRMLGRSADELLGSRDQEVTHPDDRAADLRGAEKILSGELDTWQCEKRFMRPDGDVVWVQANLFFLRDGDGHPLCWIGQFSDVTAHRRSADELRHVAEHDDLTGLANRRRLIADLDVHLAAAQVYDEQGAVLVLDLDGFKQVNDTLGHVAGDEVLVAVAGALRARVRATDNLARLGGDEFAVILPHVDAEAASSVADVLLQAIRDATPAGVTASCGIALYGPDAPGATDALLAAADRAMYAAKQCGRNAAFLAA
jgi:diguanylate cyclase (GGDEF)-like protein/PAS domain S-box-containing protein